MFRDQVLQEQKLRWIGEIRLHQPRYISYFTVLTLAVVAATILFLFQGSYVRIVQCSGALVPQAGLLKIQAIQAGVVREVHAHEGQTVQRGDLLFVLNAEQSVAQLASGAVTVQEAAAQQIRRRLSSLAGERIEVERLGREQKYALSRRLENLRAELGQIDSEIETQRARLRLAENNWKRYEDLVAKNYISPAQAQQYEGESLEQRSKLQQLERARLGARRDEAAAVGELRQLEPRIAAQLDALDRTESGARQELAENEGRTSLRVLAPQAGVLTGIIVQPGASIASGAPMATLIPAGSPLEAQLMVPSSAVGFVKSGQEVMLRFAAFPYEKFGQHRGRVVNVSRTALPATEFMASGLSIEGSSRSAEAMYRVAVQLESQSIRAFGSAHPLVAGMALDASIRQERRRLWEWVFEPLYTVTGKL